MTAVPSTPLTAPPLPPGRPRLVLTGFMGTGKSSAGRLAGQRLGLPFLDLDRVIEREARMPIAEIFRRRGEPAFRSLERRTVEGAARLSGLVVAAGGGAVLDPGSFSALAEGSVVAVLTCDEEELIRRVGDMPVRPLLEPDLPGRVRTLTRDRAEAYAAAGEGLDTSGRSVDEVADLLVERYRASGSPGPTSLAVRGLARAYAVVMGRGTLDRLGPGIRDAVPEARTAALVCDPAVENGPARRVGEMLGEAGLRVAGPIAVPRGEAAKTASVVARLWARFVDERLERSDVVVAVGGGAALDATGFAAATFARGVALANVPTTLLGMVDAALGGKVAIDHGEVKNSVGAFHDPALVIVDPDLLRSLPAEHLRTGLAEAVKAFVLAAPLGLHALEAFPEEPTLDWLIEQAVRIKAAYVAADPSDRLLRHSLNLGHTFAHGLEAASGYAMSHGEAVAVGLVAAARLGAATGVTDPELAIRLAGLLAGLGLPAEPPGTLDRRRVVDAMKIDKKRRSGRSVFVVPSHEGAHLLHAVGDDQAADALWGGPRG